MALLGHGWRIWDPIWKALLVSFRAVEEGSTFYLPFNIDAKISKLHLQLMVYGNAERCSHTDAPEAWSIWCCRFRSLWLPCTTARQRCASCVRGRHANGDSHWHGRWDSSHKYFSSRIYLQTEESWQDSEWGGVAKNPTLFWKPCAACLWTADL